MIENINNLLYYKLYNRMELQLLEMPKNDQLLHKIIDYKKE